MGLQEINSTIGDKDLYLGDIKINSTSFDGHWKGGESISLDHWMELPEYQYCTSKLLDRFRTYMTTNISLSAIDGEPFKEPLAEIMPGSATAVDDE